MEVNDDNTLVSTVVISHLFSAQEPAFALEKIGKYNLRAHPCRGHRNSDKRYLRKASIIEFATSMQEKGIN